jgi:hypothetical protein
VLLSRALVLVRIGLALTGKNAELVRLRLGRMPGTGASCGVK